MPDLLERFPKSVADLKGAGDELAALESRAPRVDVGVASASVNA